MAVLSVDLAYRRWSDVGIVVLGRASAAQAQEVALRALPPVFPASIIDGHDRGVALEGMPTTPGAIACEIIASESDDEVSGPVDANILAGRLNHLCTVRNIRVMMLDGPQAWKSLSNGLEHSRVSERQLNTAAKTGLPGMVKPVTYRAFAEFCLDIYDALCRRGWRRLETQEQPGSPPDRVLVESYPHAAWKSLGLKPLPSKRRCQTSDLAEAYGALRSIIPFTTNQPPNHDQLQAIVGGLAGLALEEHDTAATRIVGNPPRREGGHWREGFIVLPVLPTRPANMDWLHSMHWLD
jgi:Protein of unknown function (DUF429)